jgi:tetratricopeptide (TPR) repeat protein
MREEDWATAVTAFHRVVSMEPESYESWGNIGAVHMGTKNFEGALHAFQEALRIRRNSWKMWENYRQVLTFQSTTFQTTARYSHFNLKPSRYSRLYVYILNVYIFILNVYNLILTTIVGILPPGRPQSPQICAGAQRHWGASEFERKRGGHPHPGSSDRGGNRPDERGTRKHAKERHRHIYPQILRAIRNAFEISKHNSG